MAIKATFSPTARLLTEFGDSLDNAIVTSRDAAGQILVNGGAVPIQGGTDVMVELNFDRYRPEYLLDLTRVSELRQWGPDNGRIRLGAGLTYTRILTELGGRLPGLAMASRTVGSPQIRNRGTVGGNLGAPRSQPIPGHQELTRNGTDNGRRT